MKVALGLGATLLVAGIALGSTIAPGFFAITAAGVAWLAVVALVALRRATRLAVRPVEKENLLHRPPLARFLPYPSPPVAGVPRSRTKSAPTPDDAPPSSERRP